MRKPACCIYENKDADQLRSNCADDQRLCLRCTDSKSLYYQPSSVAAQPGLSDLVRNPEDRFSHNEAHLKFSYNQKLR